MGKYEYLTKLHNLIPKYDKDGTEKLHFKKIILTI